MKSCRDGVARWLRAFANVLLVSGITLGGAAPALAEEARPSEAQLLFSNGVELLQRTPPNYQDAYNQFLLAYEKSGRSWKVLGNLGLCALNLERDGEAIDYYRRYLNEGGDDIDEAERASIERELLLVQGNLTEVTVSANVGEAKLTVRREGSTAPAQSYRLKGEPLRLGLRAGSHTLTAESDGKKVAWEAVLEPGQAQSHAFDFNEKPATTAQPLSAAEPESGGLGSLQVAGVVTGGVGVAALVGGIVVGVLSQGKADSAREGCVDLADGRRACPEASQSEFDSASSMATVANVLFIGGGVLAATGLTLVLVGGDDAPGSTADKGAARLKISPAPTWGGAGLWATGTF